MGSFAGSRRSIFVFTSLDSSFMKLGVSHLAPDAFFGLIKRALPSVLRLSSEQCIDYFLLLFCSFDLLDSD